MRSHVGKDEYDFSSCEKRVLERELSLTPVSTTTEHLKEPQGAHHVVGSAHFAATGKVENNGAEFELKQNDATDGSWADDAVENDIQENGVE